ncbi:ecdysone oxidase-like [Oppia nitens]|uniref:ecdysone oxidase-like n=1 Tax=Oppia nitens TaxID=1686743 RepID=UPI0023DA83EC|nr:ecdysone oxidase-like [Oppia nitens]
MSSLFSVLLMLVTIINEKQNNHQNVENINIDNIYGRKFDYIVVGSGSAGAIVAYRLADETGATVLLLEAGGPQTIYNDVPAFRGVVESGVQNWNYPTNGSIHLDAGRVFGGSSAINTMNYYRESPDYYRLWADITGLQEWTFDKVLPYFLKSENNLDAKLVAKYPQYHRTGGRVSVSTIQPIELLQKVLISAQKFGLKSTLGDPRQSMGTTVFQKTTDANGNRVSTGTAFLENNKLKNLKILGNSLVTKILINKQKQAIGVEFYRSDRKYRVFANKEIILSAGSLGTSKLLMLSGVGPRDHLQQLGIPVIADLNVGRNFLSPLATMMTFDIINQSMVEQQTDSLDNIIDFFINHTGPLTYSALSALICFPELAYNQTYPELSNGCLMTRTGQQGNRTILYFLTILRRPKATGRIELVSSDPFTEPIVNMCLVCQNSDVDNLVKIIKLAIPIFTSPYMKQYIRINSPIAGCTPCADNYFCDDYLRCLVLNRHNIPGPMGGCRLGVSSESGAVVDKNFRVFGINRLRVIDSSLIPVPVEQGNAISMMIGEYGAHTVINS